MCDNSRTWVFNFALVVAAVILTVTAPLIQHVACTANEPTADRVEDNTASVVAVEAAGEGASPAAANVKPLPLTSLVKRDVGNVGSESSEDNNGRRSVRNRDVDFDAYMNEFNIQEEASIPEDILDQQHIEDGDAQYATESEATDIVFESPQQHFPKNSTTYIANKRNNDDHSNFNFKNNKKKSKTTNEKISKNEMHPSTDKMEEEYYADMVIVGDEQSSEGEDIVKQQQEEQNVDMSSGSGMYKKFKRMKAKQQNEQHHDQQQDLEQVKHQKQLSAVVELNERKFNKVPMKQAKTKQKTNIIKTTTGIHNDNTNERYNKETGEDIQRFQLNHKNDVTSSTVRATASASAVAVAVAIDNDGFAVAAVEDGNGDGDGSDDADVTAAIGDIEDNFRNEDEVFPTVIDVENDYGSTDVDKSVAASATAQRSISVQEAKGQLSTSALVGRKTKRFNRVRTFNSGDRHQEPRQYDGVHYKTRHQNLMNDNTNNNNKNKTKNNNKNMNNNDDNGEDGEDDGNGNDGDDDDDDVRSDKTSHSRNWQQQITKMGHAAILQNDYAVRSYGGGTSTRNGSNTFEDTQNASGQLGQHNGYADAADAADAAVASVAIYEADNTNNRPVEVKSESSYKAMRNEKPEHQQQEHYHRFEEDHEQKSALEQEQKMLPLQEQEQFVAKTETDTDIETAKGKGKATSQSAFEQHKARRRNNRRYGHKSHKKRYKDYLRFAMTPMTTATTIVVPLPSRNASEQSAIAAISNTNGTNLKTGQPMAATLAKLPNNSERNYENYEKKHEVEIENVAAAGNVHAEKLRKYARKLEAQKSRVLPASPIFVVGNRNAAMAARPNTAKPFYEGQINYYVETKDDEQSVAAGNEDVSRNLDSGILPTDSSNWYRRVSPVLRNGIKSSSTLIEGSESANEHPRKHHHHHHHHLQRAHQQEGHQNQNQNQHQHQHQHQHHPHNLFQHKHHHHYHHEQEYKDRTHQQHRTHHKHQQTNKHYQSAQSYPYQRKMARKPPAGNTLTGTSFSTPIPPPSYKPHAGAMQELGHQITEMEELERYYAKWPHLARVQLQVYDEHYRELHPELYPDYDQDYESAAELEEAQNANSEDANLPPYIKKYNRRNKQLLNLLEGTLPPPSRPPLFTQGHFSSLLQPGPHESSGGSRGSSPVRIDDDYMKEKRRRYHYRYGTGTGTGKGTTGIHNTNNNQYGGFQHDLFAQQRVVVNANDNTTTPGNQPALETATQKNITTKTSTTATAAMSTGSLKTKAKTSKVMIEATVQNQLPDEDVSITQEEQDEPDWQEEIETKSNGNDDEMTGNVQMSWQIEKLTTPSPSSPSPSSSLSSLTTLRPKSALFRLPSYPAISGSYINKPRSRSAQFAPSRGENTFINMHRDTYNFEKMRHMTALASTPQPPPPLPPSSASASAVAPFEYAESAPPPPPSSLSSGHVDVTVPSSKTINSFVYHRVVDSAPRFVGTGPTGLKQRLPFVAITDRRLETAKKTLMEHKKDLEQNFYPMP